MSRSVPYRRDISEACNWHQTQALDAETSIFILSQTGPTGFLLKEEGEAKNFKVFLGDIHNCTCPVFKKVDQNSYSKSIVKLCLFNQK